MKKNLLIHMGKVCHMETYMFLKNNYIIPLSRYGKFTRKSVLGLCLWWFCNLQLHAQTVSTFAGNGTPGFLNTGTSTSAQFNSPFGVAVDRSGNVYVADQLNHSIRKITSSGVVSTFAGNGTAGFADNTGALAQFDNPAGISVDTSGNVYVADKGNHRIRKITPAGVVTTYAGSGMAGYNNGPVKTAKFDNPVGVAVNTLGDVYVADFGNNRIRKITAATSMVSVLAGSGAADFANGNGVSAKFNGPTGVAIGTSGYVYIADFGNNRIRRIDSLENVVTIAGSGSPAYLDGNGGNAQFYLPNGIAVDKVGNLYIADKSNHRIRKIDTFGNVTTIAGSGAAAYMDGTSTTAQFNAPTSLAVDTSGKVYVADQNNQLIRAIAPAPGSPLGLEILYLDAYNRGNSNQLIWKLDEPEEGEFEVFHSVDGRNFSTLGRVDAGSALEYNFVHQSPADLEYYKIHHINKAGKVVSSNMKTLKKGSTWTANIFPNPVIGQNAKFELRNVSSDIHYRVFDVMGKLVQTGTIPYEKPNITSTIFVGNLNVGVYSLVANHQGTTKAFQFIIEH